jgi:hypothetical protein
MALESVHERTEKACTSYGVLSCPSVALAYATTCCPNSLVVRHIHVHAHVAKYKRTRQVCWVEVQHQGGRTERAESGEQSPTQSRFRAWHARDALRDGMDCREQSPPRGGQVAVPRFSRQHVEDALRISRRHRG